MKLARRCAYVLLLLASGCAALGVPTPTSFNERVAAGYTTVNAVIDETKALLVAKKIKPEDAQDILKQTDNAIQAIDLARVMGKTDLQGASTRLTATLTALTALQTYLAGRKK